MGQISKISDGTHQTPTYKKTGIRFVSVENINSLYNSDKYISEEDFHSDFKVSPKANDILMTRIGDIGTPAIICKNEPLAYYVSLALIRPNNKIISPNYLLAYIQTPYFKKELWNRTIHVAFPKKINKGEIEKCSVKMPSIDIQNKIASIINALSMKIECQNKIINCFESLIRRIRNLIFYSFNKNNNDETQGHKLGEFLKEYSKKNLNNSFKVASVGKNGIRLRSDVYSKNLTNDYTKNKVIETNTLVIGMGSKQIDIGILTEDSAYCVSPAYSTFKIVGIEAKYLDEYLIYLNKLLSKKYMISGARQGKSVNKNELLQHDLSVHSQEKQILIIQLFKFIYKQLEIEKNINILYKMQKKYLLQNLFI